MYDFRHNIKVIKKRTGSLRAINFKGGNNYSGQSAPYTPINDMALGTLGLDYFSYKEGKERFEKAKRKVAASAISSKKS